MTRQLHIAPLYRWTLRVSSFPAAMLALFVVTAGFMFQDAAAQADDSDKLQSVVVKDVDLTSGKVLYNLREGRAVAAAYESTDDWDIGFESISVFTNGEGQMVIQEFDFIDQAPNAGYKENEGGESMGLESEELGSWYNYNPDTHVVTAHTDRTFVIRTVDGTYVKVQMLSYYKQDDPDKGAPRYLTFRYAHQPDKSSTDLSSSTDSSVSTFTAPDTMAH